MATLYELTGNYAKLLELAEDGAVDPEVLHDTMDSITEAIDDKATGYVQVIKQLEADSKEIKAEIDRLRERKASFDNNVKHLKQVMIQQMQEVNRPKIKNSLFTIWIQSSSSVAIEDDNPEKVDFNYAKREVVTTVDKKALARDLKAGKEIKGAKLVYNNSLRVR